MDESMMTALKQDHLDLDEEEEKGCGRVSVFSPDHWTLSSKRPNHLNSMYSISPLYIFFFFLFLPQPCRRTRQHWQCLRPSVEMFCTDYCPMCLCPLNRYGKYLDFYLHAHALLYAGTLLLPLLFSPLPEPSGVAPQI